MLFLSNTSITFETYARKCSVLVPIRSLTAFTALPSTFLFFDVETARGFLNDMSMTPASDMAPSIVIVTPFAVGMVAFRRCASSRTSMIPLGMQIEPCFVDEHAIFAKVQTRCGLPFLNFFLSQSHNSIRVPCCSQLLELLQCYLTVLHQVSM